MFLTIVIAILIFGLLIIAHEFGHFITAIKSGVTVEEILSRYGPLIAPERDKNYNVFFTFTSDWWILPYEGGRWRRL